MPWGDGTGPMGYGPMTGRGAGYCVIPLTGYADPVFGRGFPGGAYSGAPKMAYPPAAVPYGPAAFYHTGVNPYGLGRPGGFGRGFGRGRFGRRRGFGRRWW